MGVLSEWYVVDRVPWITLTSSCIYALLEEYLVNPMRRTFWIARCDVLLRSSNVPASIQLRGNKRKVRSSVAVRKLVGEYERRAYTFQAGSYSFVVWYWPTCCLKISSTWMANPALI